MKRRIEMILARLIFWALIGKAETGERPVDAAIRKHKLMLSAWNHAQRKEIIIAILNAEWPNKHLHQNPKRKAA